MAKKPEPLLDIPKLEEIDFLKEPLKVVDELHTSIDRLSETFKQADGVVSKLDTKMRQSLEPAIPISTPAPPEASAPTGDKGMEREIHQEVESLQSIVGDAQTALKEGNVREALQLIEEGKNTTTCPVCVDKLERIKLDTMHAGAVCDLGRGGEDCDDTVAQVQQKLEQHKTEWIPKATKTHYERYSKGEVEHADGTPTVRKSQQPPAEDTVDE